MIDYGHGIPAEELVKRVISDRVKILLISVLMLASALRIKDVRRMLAEQGIHPKIIVGGAPFRFDSQLWKEVGADDMGQTASSIKILKITIVHRYFFLPYIHRIRYTFPV